jgi:hypothetical protein
LFYYNGFYFENMLALKYIYFIILMSIFFNIKAQVPYVDYVNPYATYLGLSNFAPNGMWVDNQDNLCSSGMVIISSKLQTFILKKNNVTQSYNYKVYAANPETTLQTVVYDKTLSHNYLFIATDATIGCSSGGVKVLKIDKQNLNALDSVFFCDPSKASAGAGYYLHHQFYTHSSYSQYYPPLPYTYTKNRNILRRIDTNLVMLNEKVLGDTTTLFVIYSLHESVNDKCIIVNALDQTANVGGTMLLKLDSMGNEIWRKNYYPPSVIGSGTGNGYGIKGFQQYAHGYIALVNLGYGCSPYVYSNSIIAKMDVNGNLIKEVQYTSAGDTTLEFYSNFTTYVPRTMFANFFIKTHDGNFASLISETERYGWGTNKNYIAILDTNLNIIHRSPTLGVLYGVSTLGMTQADDGTFYVAGSIANSTNNGSDVRVYSYKLGDTSIKVNGSSAALLGLYPNPAKTNLTVSSNGGNKNITVYNTLGQVVQTDTTQGLLTIDVSSWPEGLYLLEIEDTATHKKEVAKFIKE